MVFRISKSTFHPNRRQSVIVLEGSTPCGPVMSLSSGKPDTVDRMLTPSEIPTVKVHCTEVTTHPVPVTAPITSFLLYLGVKSLEMKLSNC